MDELVGRLRSALGDKYRIVRELGGGGMSRVFVAEDVELGRKVVLKALPPDLAAGLSIERFRREIHLAAQLQHPNVVPLHASGQAAGLLYYTMPLVEGESLRAKLAREGEQPVSETIRLLRDIADALAYAHEHGVVHRDIKPDNVLVSRHHGLVTDFGVAKALTESSGGGGQLRSTSAGVALGTPAYMAPEQAAADPHADHRADIYALGVLGYEMLTGRPPFTGPTPQAVLAAQVTQRPEPVGMLRSSVPPALAALIMRCLEKKPADRWQTADEVLQQLEAMATPSGGTAPTAATAAVHRGRNLRWFALPLLAAVAVATVLWGYRRTENSPMELSEKVVAVLPFRVTGADPSLAYLGDGMVDLLAARLTGEGGPRAVDPRVAIGSYHRLAKEAAEGAGDAAVTVARGLGAGLVIDGGVVGSPSRLVLTASLRRVPSGSVRAQANVQGPADSLAGLIDRLTGQLLLIGAGETEQTAATSTSLPTLRAFLEAQAAYRQGQYEQAITSYQRALRADSTFALAALGLIWASAWGASNSDDETGTRLAWAARDRLSQRDRLLLEAEIGPSYPGLSSRADILAARERAVKVVPDRADAWYQLGDLYHHWGSLIGVEDSWERAAAAFERALELDPTFISPLVHLVERVAGARDTSAVRRFGTIALQADSVTGTSDYFRMIMALSLGDTASLRAIRSRFDHMLDRTLGWISFVWQHYGWPGEDMHRALAVLRGRASTREALGFVLVVEYVLALNEGRPQKAQAFRQELSETPGIPSFLLPDPIVDAIYWQADTGAASNAARALAGSADGPVSRSASDRASQYEDICSLEQWRLHRGQTKTASRAIAKLRTAAEPLDSAEIVAFSSQCALMLDAWSATLEKRPDAARKLASLDSLVRSGPAGWDRIQYANLLVGRLHEMHGDLARANMAVRRATTFGLFPVMLSSYLREQGRLEALTGNRKRAIAAYQHYLALRSNPEPVLQNEVDEVKAELAKLVGER